MNFIQKLFGQRLALPETLRHIRDAKDLKGKAVLVRADFNVPLGDDMKVDDDEAWRIAKALPTIEFLQNAGAKIILISHIGRDPKESLRPVADYFNQKLNINVGFIPAVTGDLVTAAVDRLGNGQIVMLENVRSDDRETKNKRSLAKELSKLGDMYVSEAFSNAHRKHASMVRLPRMLPSYVGFQFYAEVTHLQKVLRPEHPLLVIIGGAKFGTKLPLITKMLPIADTLFIGGALVNTIFKYKGYEIGTSMFEENTTIKNVMNRKNVMIPSDVVVEDDTGKARETVPNKVQKNERIVDLSDQSLRDLEPFIERAHTVVWNGPLGYYEGGYEHGTKKLLDIIAKNSAQSIIGGGDTVFVIRKYSMEKDFSFVSTAGGAMLDYLVDGTLPAIKALS